jgi:hypothetical protein
MDLFGNTNHPSLNEWLKKVHLEEGDLRLVDRRMLLDSISKYISESIVSIDAGVDRSLVKDFALGILSNEFQNPVNLFPKNATHADLAIELDLYFRFQYNLTGSKHTLYGPQLSVEDTFTRCVNAQDVTVLDFFRQVVQARQYLHDLWGDDNLAYVEA